MDDQHLERLKVSELKQFLKDRGKRSAGTKSELLKLAKYFKNDPVISSITNPSFDRDEADLNALRKIFDQAYPWEDVQCAKNTKIPKSFSDETISKFLNSVTVTTDPATGLVEVMDYSTSKPRSKGRLLYSSEKVQVCQTTTTSEFILFRCTMSASMKKTVFRHPYVALDSTTGEIKITKCSCEVLSDGKCAHVACLLFLVEDLAMKVSPRICTSCTSTKRVWGQGSKVDNDPKPLHSKKYCKKRDVAKVMKFKPVPDELIKVSDEEINEFLSILQRSKQNSMWEHLLHITYEDYRISAERVRELKDLVNIFVENMSANLTNFHNDPHSNISSYHVTGSEEQSKSQVWKRYRRYRVTASMLKDFVQRPKVLIEKMLWTKQEDISHCASVKWGIQHEATAIQEITPVLGPITQTGLHISRSHPYMGASPDGIAQDGLVEIKCPYILRDHKPNGQALRLRCLYLRQ